MRGEKYMKKILIVLSVVIALCIGFVVFMTCGNKKTTAKLIKEYESKGSPIIQYEKIELGFYGKSHLRKLGIFQGFS